MRRAAAALLSLLCGPAECAEAPAPLPQGQRWPPAQDSAARSADPLAGKLVAFYRLLTPHQASLAELDEFRAENPDWPQPTVLQHRREEALAAEPDDAAVLASCGRVRPEGAAALARCAEALLRQGQPDAAAETARAAWLVLASDGNAEAEFLRTWGPTLGPGDQWQRFERLAWADTPGAARQLPLLAPADRPMAQAWLALRRDDPRADGLVSALPAAEQRAPGLVLERVRWLRRAHRDVEATDLLTREGVAAEGGMSEAHRTAFWDERNLIARRRLRDGDPAGAYALTAETGQTAPEAMGDAAFLAGWVALRRLARPDDARRHFQALQAVSRAAISQARAHFWLARAATDPTEAKREDALAAGFPTTYYGQLAASADGDAAARLMAARDPTWTQAEAAELVDQELARAAVLLAAWGEPGRAAGFLQRLSELARAPADQVLIAHLALGFGQPEAAVALARRAGRLGVALPESGWPVGARLPADLPVEPALALALIRQESSFDVGTVSPAGAAGLMQLMPATAAVEAHTLGVDLPAGALTADPALNVRLGSAYLAELLRRYDGSAPLALAAYNAGPSRVAEWLATNGDPRAGGPDMVDWIELIPLAETRNYVQRVLENAAVYRARLGESGSPASAWARSPA